jgi:hypothetical protein
VFNHESRLKFINQHSYIFGGIKRKHIMGRFGVNKITASKDIKQYKEQFPSHLMYDISKRTYVASEQFELMEAVVVDEFLHYISSGVAPVTSFLTHTDYGELTNTVKNSLNLERVKYVLRGLYLKTPVCIEYINAKSEIGTRTIEPLGITSSGPYWYVNALCHISRTLKTFLLNRVIDSCLDLSSDSIRSEISHQSKYIELTLIANPDYCYHDTRVTEIEFNFNKEFKICISEQERITFMRIWPVYWEGVTSDPNSMNTMKLLVVRTSNCD